MGKFLDFITGGNAKVMANHIANMHRDSGGNYEAVVAAVLIDIGRNNPKNSEFFNYFAGNSIRNYSILGAVQLNALAAPRGTPMFQTILQFESTMAQHLRARGIPETFVSGDNRNLTEVLARRIWES